MVDNYQLSFGTVSTDLTTDYRYGLPWRTRPTGVMVDMDRLLHQTVSKDNQQAELIKYRQLQGVQESSNDERGISEGLGDLRPSARVKLCLA